MFYIDRLTFFSCLRLLLVLKPDCIYFFEASFFGKLLPIKKEQVAFHFQDLKDENENHRFIEIINDVKSLCIQICNKEVRNNSHYLFLCRNFDSRNLLVHFGKVLERKIYNDVVCLNVIKFYLKKENSVFLRKKDLIFPCLSKYAEKFGIKLVSY